MAEVIQGYSMIFTSFINFLFELEFNDGTSVGGIILAATVLSLIIRFLFRSIQAGPGAVTMYKGYVENQAYQGIQSRIRSKD